MYPILYHKKTKWRCLVGLLLLALCTWVACASEARTAVWKQARAALGSRALLRTVVYLETGLRVEETVSPSIPDAAPASTEAQALPPVIATTAETETTAVPETAAEVEPSPETFAPEEAEAILFRGDCTYQVDKAALLLQPLDWPDKPGPKVLILHSHSCEAYTECEGHTYISSANYRTLDLENNVVAVGDALAEELAARGVEVIHDRTYNDYPDYNRSYAMAREKIQDYLDQYPSIVMVLDLHRDALEKPVRETVEFAGQTIAPLMLVIGTNEGGLNHPHWADNLSCGLKLQALANRKTPDLFKRISFRQSRFNGDLTRGSLIVEVGSTENTLPEAVAAMPYLANYVEELLHCR